MYFLTSIVACFSLLSRTSALPTSHTSSPAATGAPLPLIIWHGLGDRFDADGLLQTAALAEKVHPGTYTYTVRVADDGASDQRGTFFGNLSTQLTSVCATLSADALLNSNTTRIDALGFSQGGQFLRGLIERCPGISVRSLVTFGSQHNGIARFQACGTWDLLCKGAIAVVGGNAWTDFVQGGIVPAQYYRERDPDTGLGSDAYLNASNFLADVNNEKKEKNADYKARLARLDHFAMYVFENDTTVLPKESGWFAEVNATNAEVTLLRERTMYKEDWLGLRELDQKGALVFRTAPGAHMELSKPLLKKAFSDFFGPEKPEAVSTRAKPTLPWDTLSRWWEQTVLALEIYKSENI